MKTKTELNSIRILLENNSKVITLRFGSKRTVQRNYANLYKYMGGGYKLDFNTLDGRVSINCSKIASIQQVV